MFLKADQINLVYEMFLTNAFKAFGEQRLIDDYYLTIAASFGALCNGFSRIFWPIL
jgi:hypothetical protein